MKAVYANPAFLNSVEKTEHDVIGHHCSELITCCSNDDDTSCALQEVLSKQTTVRRHYECFPNPDWRIVQEATFSPVMSDDGSTVERILVTLEDVTETFKLEEILERYAEGLTILYELSTTFLSKTEKGTAMQSALEMIRNFFNADLVHITLPANGGDQYQYTAGVGWKGTAPVQGDLFEARSDDIVGFCMLQKCPAVVRDFSKDKLFKLSSLYENQGILSAISVPMVVDNHVFGVLSMLYNEPRLIDTAELWYMNVVANTLAVYIEKEHSLEKSEKSESFLSSVLEGIGEGVVVVDRDYRIIEANKGYAEGLGLTEQEVIKNFCYLVAHHNDAPCYLKGESCAVRGVFETGTHQSALHKHFDRGGGIHYVQTNAYPLKDSEGNVIAAIETGLDVTEQVRLEMDVEKRVNELEEFYEMAVGRELRMIELKEEIEQLRQELARHKSR